MDYQVTKSDDEWKAELTAEEYAVLRQAATERPWTGELLDENREGVYKCKACGRYLNAGTAGRKKAVGGGWRCPDCVK